MLKSHGLIVLKEEELREFVRNSPEGHALRQLTEALDGHQNVLERAAYEVYESACRLLGRTPESYEPQPKVSPNIDPDLLERAHRARHMYLQSEPGSPAQQQAGRELAVANADILFAVEADTLSQTET